MLSLCAFTAPAIQKSHVVWLTLRSTLLTWNTEWERHMERGSSTYRLNPQTATLASTGQGSSLKPWASSGSPWGSRGTSTGPHLTASPGALAGSWTGNWAPGTWTGKPKRPLCCSSQLDPLHSTGPVTPVLSALWVCALWWQFWHGWCHQYHCSDRISKRAHNSQPKAF